MPETLVANGDGDDYYEQGARIAEAHANGYGTMNVSRFIKRSEVFEAQDMRRMVPQFAGRITIRRDVPVLFN